MSKGGRTGKHAPAELTKRYPGFNEAGNRTEGISEFSPTKREFIGSGEREFDYIDPNTGFTVTIRADTVKEARRIAGSRGLIEKDKAGKRKKR